MTDPTRHTPPLPGDDEAPAWAETGAGYGGRIPRTRPDLPTWLREQVGEDRRVAEAAAQKEDGGDWYYDGDSAESVRVTTGAYPAVVNGPYGYLGEAGEHIARWDPARVLAECEAKEQLINLCDRRVPGGGIRWLDVALSRDVMTLQVLALPYSARPGYQEEWKP